MRRGWTDPGHWAEDVLLGLGSNMGHRLDNLGLGIAALNAHSRVKVVRASEVFESEFVGEGKQDPYLNACVLMHTTLPPIKLLDVLKGIEQRCGRKPASHMQPRPLDLDILFFGNRSFKSKRLEVPHPRMKDRAFVLQPLVKLLPGKKFPDSGETVGSVCAKIQMINDNRLMVRADLCLFPPS